MLQKLLYKRENEVPKLYLSSNVLYLKARNKSAISQAFATSIPEYFAYSLSPPSSQI